MVKVYVFNNIYFYFFASISKHIRQWVYLMRGKWAHCWSSKNRKSDSQDPQKPVTCNKIPLHSDTQTPCYA